MLDERIATAVARLTAAASAKHFDDALDALWALAPTRTTLASDPADPATRARLVTTLYDLGLDLKEAQRVDAAGECLHAGHLLAHDAGDAQLEASTANHLGVLAIEQGRLFSARRWFETALRLRIAAAPALTDAATVYLAGTDVNLGNVAVDDRDLDRAAAHYEAATRRLEEARSAGSHVSALGPFLGNATRGGSRAAEMRSWNWPVLASSTVAYPAPTSGLASTEVATWSGRRAEALAQADDRRLHAFALGGFLDQPDAPTPWTEEEHERALGLFDELLLETPADADLRLAKARVLERGAHAARSRGRAVASMRDSMAPDVASTVLDLHARQFRGGLARMQDAFVSAGKVAPAREAIASEASAAVDGLTGRSAKSST